MSTKALVPVEDYLRMSLDGPGLEYLDGELVERNLGEYEHGAIQIRLGAIFLRLAKRFAVFASSEQHLRLTPTRYRVVDVAVFAGEEPQGIPSSPPHVAIEIVSPGDRYNEIHDKLEEYRRWGIKHIWLVDPASRNFSVYDEAGLREVPVLELPEFELTIQKSGVFE